MRAKGVRKDLYPSGRQAGRHADSLVVQLLLRPTEPVDLAEYRAALALHPKGGGRAARHPVCGEDFDDGSLVTNEPVKTDR